MNPERKKSSKPVWLVVGIVVLGLIVLAAGPLMSATNGATESIFAAPPDPAELERLGSFDEGAADEAAGDPSASEGTARSAAGASDGVSIDRIAASLDGATVEATATTGAAAVATSTATAAGAAEAGDDEAVLGSNVAGFSSGDIFGLLWRLALVALIIWVSIFVLRKFVMRSSRASSASGALKVLETIGLSNNRLVYLLEAGDRVLVVGSTPNQMTLLAELDDPEVVSALRSDADRASPKVATLGDMMRDFGQNMGQRFSAARKSETRATAWRGSAQGFGDGSEELTPILQQLLKAQAEIELSAQRIPEVREAGGRSAKAEADAE